MPLRKFNDGQEIVMEDFNDLSRAVLKDLYDRHLYELMQRKENSFFGDSFKISFSNANTVICKKGLGIQLDALATSPDLKRKPIVLGADRTLTIVPADSVHNRIDIVCVKSAIVDEISAQRNYKDATSGSVALQDFVVQEDWGSDIVVTQGIASAVPAVPATPVGYIKIAEILVTAVTGVVDANSITEARSLMPVAGEMILNTTGFERITAGGEVRLSSILAVVDAFLKRGYFNYFDIDVLGVEPGNPAADCRRIFAIGDIIYQKKSDGTKIPVGSGGGGGGGANWVPVPGAGPLDDLEYGEKVFQFQNGETQKVTLFIKVPESYILGRQIKMKLGHYSPGSGATNKYLMSCTTSLIRKGVDAIDSIANQHIADSGDITQVTAKQYNEVLINLSSIDGKLNGVSASPGDILKLELSRGVATTGVDDATDIRMIPSTTEVIF